MWSGAQVDHFNGGEDGNTFYAVFDPSSDSVGAVQQVNNNHDMFCPGIAMLTNGDVFVVAGSAGGNDDGASSSSTWTGNAFEEGPSLNIARGYNSALTLANGEVRFLLRPLSSAVPAVIDILKKYGCLILTGARIERLCLALLSSICTFSDALPPIRMLLHVFTLGGSFRTLNRNEDKWGEVYSPSADTWRLTPNILGEAILSDDPQGVFRTDNYGFFFAWTGNSGASRLTVNHFPLRVRVCASM